MHSRRYVDVRPWALAAIVAAFGSARAETSSTESNISFTNVAVPGGVFESPGGGRAAVAIDYDNDGDQDLLIASSEVPRGEGSVAPVVLLRNDSGGSFTDVTEQAGLSDDWRDLTFGVVAADVNNDGWLDLFMGNGGKQSDHPSDILYINYGGTFVDETKARGLDAGPTQTFTGVWMDADNDGWVDLVTVGYEATPIRFWQNIGDGYFRDRTAEVGLEGISVRGQGATTGDVNRDGYLDLYIPTVSDSRNLLLINENGVRFSEQAETWALAQWPRDSYSSTLVDLDHDGWLDLVVSGYGNIDSQTFPELSRVFMNVAAPELGPGRRRMRDVSIQAEFFHRRGKFGAPIGGGAMGLQTGDFDLDGWMDLYVSNGGPWPELAEEDLLFRHLGIIDGAPRFENVTDRLFNPYSESGVSSEHMSHGVVFFDYDDDGDIDIYTNSGGPGFWGGRIAVGGQENVLWRNDSTTQNHYLQVRLLGKGAEGTNRAAIGAVVRVTAPSGGQELMMSQDVKGASGFGQQNSLWLTFGLGEHTSADIEVRWTTGEIETFSGVQVDRMVTVREGKSGGTIVP